MTFNHETVLLRETVEALCPKDGGLYVDGTLGGAGHSRLLLEQSSPNGVLYAFDQDMTAIRNAQEELAHFIGRFHPIYSNFRHLKMELNKLGVSEIDGAMFDLGVSSVQFDEAERGFSYRFDAPLDMRMDRAANSASAKDVVNTLSEAELAKIFFEFGEEKFSRRIARLITLKRAEKEIDSTQELADLIKAAIPAAARRTGPHPARRVFQALRIYVNDELGALTDTLKDAFSILRPTGRLAVITFHSLEDRIVKHAFQDWSKGCICPPEMPICQCFNEPKAKIITRKPTVPSVDEVEINPRARSAKLRVVEKI